MIFSKVINLTIVVMAMMFMSTVCQSGETTKKESITWVKYDEGLKLAAKTEKLIIVDVYTNWCKFCHKMDRETFSDKNIIEFLGENFIGVKLNAESKKKMKLSDGEFTGRDISRKFGVRGYPTYLFLNSDGELVYRTSGYSPPERFMVYLKYVSSGKHKDMTIEEYWQAYSKKK